MLSWIISNYRAAIALFGAVIALIVGYIISPFFTAAVGFILTTTQTKATVMEHSAKLSKLETILYGMDAKFDLIKKSLNIIEERNYQELKEARQRRQAEKP